jgi:hypothetical protein
MVLKMIAHIVDTSSIDISFLDHVIQLIFNSRNLPYPHEHKAHHACNKIQEILNDYFLRHHLSPSGDRRPTKIEANSGEQSSPKLRQYNNASKAFPASGENTEEVPRGSLVFDVGGHSDESTDEGGDSHDPEDREDEHPTADMRTALSSAISGIVSHSLLLQQHLGSLLLVLNGRSHKTKDEASKATA